MNPSTVYLILASLVLNVVCSFSAVFVYNKFGRHSGIKKAADVTVSLPPPATNDKEAAAGAGQADGDSSPVDVVTSHAAIPCHMNQNMLVELNCRRHIRNNG